MEGGGETTPDFLQIYCKYGIEPSLSQNPNHQVDRFPSFPIESANCNIISKASSFNFCPTLKSLNISPLFFNMKDLVVSDIMKNVLISNVFSPCFYETESMCKKCNLLNVMDGSADQ